MTWSAWVKAAANPADDGQIVAKSDDASGWQFKTSPDTGPHTFGVGVAGATNTFAQRYSTTVRSLNVWYHVAGVYNASARTLDIYVNGVLNNGTLSGTIPASQINSAVNVNIGRRSGGYYFNGVIDDVRVYNRALSQAEIQADMNTPVGSPTPLRHQHQHQRLRQHLRLPHIYTYRCTPQPHLADDSHGYGYVQRLHRPQPQRQHHATPTSYCSYSFTDPDTNAYFYANTNNAPTPTPVTWSGSCLQISTEGSFGGRRVTDASGNGNNGTISGRRPGRLRASMGNALTLQWDECPGDRQ